ncbi:MAG: hypothetical protein HYY03_05985 [Chloroflexi bacterium]|nr:hypothetical protein [Chloroflexota bacterium]
MIAIFAAMESEVGACLGSFTDREESTIAGYPAVRGGLAVVCRTGMGRRAQQCVAAVLPQLSPSAVLSVGTAGGLHAERRAGDIILCQRVDHAEARGSALEARPATSDPALIEAAEQVAEALGLPARRGSCVTVDSVAWTPQEKNDLHGWMEHDVVEMESFWVGRAAAQRKIPFLAVRVVSDQAGDHIPEIPGLVSEDGSVDYSRFLPYVREHPELVPILAEQTQRSRLATDNLQAFLTAFLPMASRLVSGQRPL